MSDGGAGGVLLAEHEVACAEVGAGAGADQLDDAGAQIAVRFEAAVRRDQRM
ncbi:hypothetical protein OG539_01745 [Actinacidiphila glaucinigra]|uniref:hypothetical protein n=1 Tax=Actinacidiphila glaucinigra TaxID=235986 RepID=UPI0032502F5E